MKTLNIGQVQELATLKDLNPIEQMAHEVSICLGIPFSDVEIWQMSKLKEEHAKLKLDQMPDQRIGFKFKHKGRRFRLVKNAKEMSAHHFIELQEVVKGILPRTSTPSLRFCPIGWTYLVARLRMTINGRLTTSRNWRPCRFMVMRFFFLVSIRSCWPLP